MALGDRLRALGLDRWFFTLLYWRGRPPWDSGITPPELVRVVEGTGPEHRQPGRALDLGCGTGTNSLYLARHGWDVTGVDFAAPAIARAREKRARTGTLLGTVRFVRGDVTQLNALDARGPYDLVLDLGCLHSIAPAARARYAAQVAERTRPGTLLMLYALAPTFIRGRAIGMTLDDVRGLFVPGWTVERVEPGQNPGGRASAWYWLLRTT